MTKEVTLRVEPLRMGMFPLWMLNDHYQENAVHRDLLTRPDPDWAEYIALQNTGNLLLVVARDKESLELVGYSILIFRRHLHFKGVIIALDDLHYLKPDYRGVGNGTAMLAYAESVAKERGAEIFNLRHKAAQDHGSIFRDMGYQLTDIVWTKDIRNVAPL